MTLIKRNLGKIFTSINRKVVQVQGNKVIFLLIHESLEDY